MGLWNKLKSAWNAFIYDEKRTNRFQNNGYSSTFNPSKSTFSPKNERSIISTIINRIAIDVASVRIREVEIDENNRFTNEVTNTGLSTCLNLEANKDQTSRAFIQDCAENLLNNGYIAIVPIDTDTNPEDENAFDVYSMRIGRIIQWYPDSVMLEVYDDRNGVKKNIIMPKSSVAIIENPLYAIMNEHNSTLQRLINRLNILDVVDSQAGSGKLDLIIQLPYVVKTDQRRDQAEKRRKDIEEQLSGSKYGIAYTDGTEKITQLNRSVDNNLLTEVQYLTSMLFSQLGITEAVLNGTAKPEEMQNYNSRTVEPIVSAIVDEMNRKFLTKTARTQGKRIMFFKDVFKLVPVEKIADIADKFTRNEILSPNELRQIVGFKPVNDGKSDELINRNMPIQDQQEGLNAQVENSADPEQTNAELNALEEEISALEESIK